MNKHVVYICRPARTQRAARSATPRGRGGRQARSGVSSCEYVLLLLSLFVLLAVQQYRERERERDVHIQDMYACRALTELLLDLRVHPDAATDRCGRRAIATREGSRPAGRGGRPAGVKYLIKKNSLTRGNPLMQGNPTQREIPRNGKPHVRGNGAAGRPWPAWPASRSATPTGRPARHPF